MTVLRLVMVAAFLFSFVIADNGNFMRPSGQPFRSSQPQPNSNHRDLYHSYDTSNPWTSRRIAENGPDSGPPLDIPDSIASSNSPPSRYIQRFPKPVDSNDDMMILEPMPRHRESSWTDWMPDFFGDDSPPGPGPLIGPMEFPGIGKKVFIRQNEPLDEDTNRVVIHLINRETPPTYGTPVSHQSHPPQQYNQQPYYTEDPMKQHDRHYGDSFTSIRKKNTTWRWHSLLKNFLFSSNYMIPGKSSVIQQNEYPSKMTSSDPWKLSGTAPDKEIKDKKTSYPTHDRLLEVPNDPRYSVMLLKQSGSNIPNVIWTLIKTVETKQNSRPPDHRGNYYGRSLDSTESKDPATFPSTNNSSSASDKQSNLPQSKASGKVLEQQHNTLRRYGYQNNNRSPQYEIPRFKQPLNHLDEITLVNKAELNRRRGGGFAPFFDGSPIRTPRHHQYSGTKHFARSLPPPIRQKLPAAASGGLQVIPAPNLQRGPLDSDNSTGAKPNKNSTGEEVMHNIMSMTASQSWKNITSRSPKMIGEKNAIETEEKKSTTSKPEAVAVIERRIDEESTIEEETKEEQAPTESVPIVSSTAAPVVANKTDKAQAKMKEAVQKMMGSFSLWRHKVVSTKFLKELEEKQKHKKTKSSKKSETDAKSR
ncbi:hypothetical protein TSAR_002756 [Trichomalopsis sarcophagae]|uniref:Uncharacterized protein n=1 Tax=Trichomalopsis sarcophagae TaxID=543379 RepID=A0A232ELH0_9HYME|nr:hypothetical protein TSAR_002756 [Trichomalopsis sarcophagae]